MAYRGTGIYTIGDAARLVGAEPRQVRRWLFGYDFKSQHKDGTTSDRHSEPLWASQYAEDDELNESAIGFRDLLELRIVRAFVKCGVSLLVVRRCLQQARQIFASDYPFTAQRFRTDGQTIFLEAAREGADEELLDLRQMQYVFREVVKASLYAGIEYEGEAARRWFPDANRRTIVLDPAVQFGKPVLVHSAVPTQTLYSAYQAEGADSAAIGMVASIYEVPPKEVQAAVRFEESLLAA